MAPGRGDGGAGDGDSSKDAALSNGGGGSTNGDAAAAPVPAGAGTAPPQQTQRALGGFKIKVKLPPRQPSGDGASVAGDGMATDANAASLKRPAEGPPPDVGGAAGPPHKLKITLK